MKIKTGSKVRLKAGRYPRTRVRTGTVLAVVKGPIYPWYSIRTDHKKPIQTVWFIGDCEKL